MASELTDVHLNPLKVLMKLEDIMAEDSIIVADGGDFVGSAAYILRYRTFIQFSPNFDQVIDLRDFNSKSLYFFC
jgi:thiamine pyrophosphate-dependent acetolactate synthase large subunit-like protein